MTVPSGALVQLDFGSNEFYAGGASTTPDQIISGFDAGEVSGGLYTPTLSGLREFIGAAQSSILDAGGFRIVVQGKAPSIGDTFFELNDGFGHRMTVYTDSSAGAVVEDSESLRMAAGLTPYTANDEIRFVATFTPSKIAISDRGGPTAATVMDPAQHWFPWTLAKLTRNQSYRVITVYAPSADEGSALSAL